MTIREKLGLEPTDKLPECGAGCYDLLYITDDGGVLCAKCANESGSENDDDRHTGWYLEAVDSSANSDSCHYCDNCNAQLAGYCTEDEHSEHCDNRPQAEVLS